MIELVLVILYLNKKMRVEMDILDFTIEEVLSIKYENEKWRPVAVTINISWIQHGLG